MFCSLSSKKCCIRQLNEVRDDLRYYNEFKTIGRNSYATDNKAYAHCDDPPPAAATADVCRRHFSLCVHCAYVFARE